MITSGYTPGKNAFVVAVGRQEGGFVPVIGSVVEAGKPSVIYAGVGEQKGDKVYFAPGSWESQPMSISDAIAKALAKANLQDWVEVELPIGAGKGSDR